MADSPEVSGGEVLSAPLHQSLWQVCGHSGSWAGWRDRGGVEHIKDSQQGYYSTGFLSSSLTLTCIMHPVWPSERRANPSERRGLCKPSRRVRERREEGFALFVAGHSSARPWEPTGWNSEFIAILMVPRSLCDGGSQIYICTATSCSKQLTSWAKQSKLFKLVHTEYTVHQMEIRHKESVYFH